MNEIENSVFIKEIRDTRNPDVKQVFLVQELPKTVASQKDLISMTMQGVQNFTNNISKRHCIHNFSTLVLETNGLMEGSMLPEHWNPKLVVKEYTIGEKFEQEDLAFSLTNAPKFAPYNYETSTGRKIQQPKTAGQGGGVCMIDNKPIYRNIYLSLYDMPKNDKFIIHNSIGIFNPDQVPSTSAMIADFDI